ncbi:MAG: rhodanese-like domain-containing protein [Nitrospirae bacterium]|nr:rhodanese-like domain-containing protein [Nitrospirota bacterium]
MKKLNVLFLALVLAVVFLAPAAYAADDMAAKMNEVLSKAAAEKFWQLSADDVKAMIDAKKTDFLIVDARPAPDMFKAGHIPGAIHIPVQDMLKPENIKKLPKDKKIIVVCVTGQTQNLPIVTLRAMGYNALTMKFGMAAWDKNSIGVKFMKEALQGAETKNYPLQK